MIIPQGNSPVPANLAEEDIAQLAREAAQSAGRDRA